MRRPFLISSLLLCAAVLTLYSVCLGHNFLFDEENIIIRNPYIKDLSSIPEIFRHGFFYVSGGLETSFMEYYRPLTTLSYLMDYQIWKLNPLGYNLTSTLLHLMVCLLLFRLLTQIFQHTGAALLAALIYSIHTIHTEAIGHVSGRGETLGALFLLLSLIFYLRSRQVFAVLFYLFGLFAKESALLIPLYLWIFDVCFIKTKAQALLKKMSPFLTVAVSYIAYRKYFCPVHAFPPQEPWRAALLRVSSMGIPFLNYLKALTFPQAFKLFDSIDFAKNFSDPRVTTTALIAGLLLMVWLLTLRRRGAAFFGMIVFLGGLLPFIQIFHFYPEWAEHFLTIPAIGFVILIGCFFREVLKSNNRLVKIIFIASSLVFISFLCARTFQRNQLYNDAAKYYDTLSRSDSPYAASGYQELAKMRLQSGEFAEATRILRTALGTGINLDITHELLGWCYLREKKYEQSLWHYEQAARFNDRNDSYKIDVGNALMKLGKNTEAIEIFEKVRQKNPGYYPIYRSLLYANELAGRPEKALEWAERGLSMSAKKDLESATLVFSVIRLAYREGWWKILDKKLSRALQNYSNIPWYGEVARVLAGRTGVEQFTESARLKYSGFEEEAQSYILMSHVLQKRYGPLRSYITTHKEILENEAANDPFFKKELDRSKEALKSA